MSYTPSQFQNHHVLLVDDSKTVRKIIKDIFISIGFNKDFITECANPDDALQILEKSNFNLITSNMWMSSNLNGIQFLEKIRSSNNEALQKTPFLFISGEKGIDHKNQAIGKGANGYISKPFVAKNFENYLNKIFSQNLKGETSFSTLAENETTLIGSRESFQNVAGMKVLVVDDSQANLLIIREVLSGLKLKITESISGEGALKVLLSNLPDLILLDITMAGMDGYETCKTIKADKKFSHIPIIFITSLTETKDIIKGLSLGAVDYIVKPFEKEEILHRVHNQLVLRKSFIERQSMIEELKDLSEKKDLLINELTELKEQLELSSKTDPLTNLLNRRGAMELIEKEISRFHQTNIPFTLVLSDIDHFKHVNDTYGHDAGDFILNKMGEIFNSNHRKYDRVARWGGEEFLVLLPETEIEDGKRLAENFRGEIEALELEHKGHEIPITMSFGVSQYGLGSDSLDSCLKIADENLYEAKDSGRNLVVG
jgi:diguanylate cyclase (GGDEF)-like protein